MKKEIIVGIISAIVGSAATLFIGLSFGIFEKTLSDSQVEQVTLNLVDKKKYRNVLIKKLVSELTNVNQILVGTHDDIIRGKDKEVQILFEPSFSEIPQVYVAVSGFGAKQDSRVGDAYAKVEKVTKSGAIIRCTAYPYGNAWLKINWIAVGRPLFLSEIPVVE